MDIFKKNLCLIGLLITSVQASELTIHNNSGRLVEYMRGQNIFSILPGGRYNVPVEHGDAIMILGVPGAIWDISIEYPGLVDFDRESPFSHDSLKVSAFADKELQINTGRLDIVKKNLSGAGSAELR